MIEKILGVPNATKDMSDDDFEKILPQLATELEHIDYNYSYTNDELYLDWRKLYMFKEQGTQTSSSIRTGMKLCEHFFPNFFDIKNSKNQSVKSLWKAEKLEKVLRWNRKSHSTPYLSELRRGVYFCNGLTKNTMFRPHLAKLINDSEETQYTLDPCCGWGGRMLGAVASGKNYIGFDPNPETFENLNRLAHFLEITKSVTLIKDGAENMDKYDFPNVGVVLTSPPYFNLEIYHDGKQQSENNHDSYQNWLDNWLADVIKKSMDRLTDDGISAWNVHNVGKMKLIDDVKEIHEKNKYEFVKDFSLGSSARQSNQSNQSNKSVKKHKKNSDVTNVFKSKKG